MKELTYASPWGELRLFVSNGCLHRLRFGSFEERESSPGSACARGSEARNEFT